MSFIASSHPAHPADHLIIADGANAERSRWPRGGSLRKRLATHSVQHLKQVKASQIANHVVLIMRELPLWILPSCFQNSAPTRQRIPKCSFHEFAKIARTCHYEKKSGVELLHRTEALGVLTIFFVRLISTENPKLKSA